MASHVHPTGEQNDDALCTSIESKLQPKPKPTFPLSELKVVQAIPRGPCGEISKDLLPFSLKVFVDRKFPLTEYVDIDNIKGTYYMWGWNKIPENHVDWNWGGEIKFIE